METAGFADIIKEWRNLRRYSQLQLSLEAGISARHISFLESGRAKPSRDMVIKLASALDMPKGAANAALNRAGFAPVFPALPPDHEALAPIRDAVEHVLKSHDPFPAIAIDRWWDVTAANDASQALFAGMGVTGRVNMIEVLLTAGEGDIIANWEENALLILSRLRSEIAHYGDDSRLAQYAAQLSSHPRLRLSDTAIDFTQVMVPTLLDVEGDRLSLFSTIAQFGSVQDVNASDLRIEMMFPADESTARYFRERSAL